MERSWQEAIKKVLAESEIPLHYTEISEQILSRGYYETGGATPAASVSAQVTSSIKKDGAKSPFLRVGRGIYTLKVVTSENTFSVDDSGAQSDESVDDSSNSIIHSFGMYWQRDLIVWRNDPKVYGKQQALSKSIDFGKQRGIYILYDHHTVVYVGRSIDRPLGKRLYEHTLDRLGSRWNRFSWFGLLDVKKDGELKERPFNASQLGLITTLEALLIEALEPPQNRRRGDDLTGIEYVQAIDDELKEKELQNTLRSIEQKLRGGS